MATAFGLKTCTSLTFWDSLICSVPENITVTSIDYICNDLMPATSLFISEEIKLATCQYFMNTKVQNGSPVRETAV